MFTSPFAQAVGGPSDSEVAVFLVAAGGVIFTVAGLAMNLVFLTTLKRVLEQCAPHNRRMEPGQVYLNLIPCFGTIWMFFTVGRVGQTLRDEFDERGIDAPGDFGQQLGISFAALMIGWLVPYVGLLFGFGGIVCWIVYWVKMAEFNRILREGESYSEERDDYRRRRRNEQRRRYEADDDQSRSRDDD